MVLARPGGVRLFLALAGLAGPGPGLPRLAQAWLVVLAGFRCRFQLAGIPSKRLIGSGGYFGIIGFPELLHFL